MTHSDELSASLVSETGAEGARGELSACPLPSPVPPVDVGEGGIGVIEGLEVGAGVEVGVETDEGA